MNLLQASEIKRRGEKIPRRQQAGLVIALSVPAILEQLVLTLMSYIDTAMVGSLGYFATASIGVVASTTWLLNGLVSAAAVGFSVQVAQYLGAGRERDSRDVLCQAILFNAAFGAALAVLAVLAGQFLPAALGAEAALRPYARAYFCTVAAFLPFSMACAFYSSILRCSGSVVLPSVLNVGMCLLDMRMYRVIYDAINEIESAMKGMLAPKYREAIIGHAEVRQTFHASAVGTIAGCYVKDGKITRDAKVRILRDNIVIHEGELAGLQRFKDSVKEVQANYECGITIEKYSDIKEGDVFECFIMEEIPQ